MPHADHRLFDPDCIVCQNETFAARLTSQKEAWKAGRQMWQGSTVAVLQSVYNMLINDEPREAKKLIETYLKHLGEWVD